MYRPEYLDDLIVKLVIGMFVSILIGFALTYFIKYIQALDLLGQLNFLL